ncbi:MAG: aquaporin [Actinomycetota bacterium]
MERIWQRATAEFFAILTFTFIGAGSVVILRGTDPAGLLGIALAHGLTMTAMVSITGHISGGHVNPAVTIGAWVTNQIKTGAALVYIVAQLLGAATGAALLRASMPAQLITGSTLGTPAVAHTLGLSNGKAVLLEAVLAFFLVFVVYGMAVDDRGPFSKIAGFPVGLIIGTDILVGGPLTGAAMNPARWFGPAFISGTWTDWWVYLIGPIGGGVIAASVYWFAFLGGREKFARVPRSQKPIEGPDTPLPEEGEGVTGLPGVEG